MRVCLVYVIPALIRLVLVGSLRADVHDSIRRIRAYCEHSEPNSEWLECERTVDGEPKVEWSSKRGGLVLQGRIHPEMLANVLIYRSDALRQRDAPKRDWTWLKLSAPIRVVLRVSVTASGVLKTASTAAACFYQFADGRRVGPASYFVREKATGLLHPIHDLAYLQERLDGDTVWELINQMNRNEVEEVASLSLDLLRGQASIQQALRALQRELGTRALRRLFLVDAVAETALELWKAGLMHCDSHPRNVVIVKHYTQSLAEVEQLLEEHPEKIHVFPSLWDRLSKREKQRAIRSGVEYFLLDHQSMRYVDTGKMLELIPLQSEINRTVEAAAEDGPDHHLFMPCAHYKGGTPGDLEALIGEAATKVLSAHWSLNSEIRRRLERRKESVFESCRGGSAEGRSPSSNEMCEALDVLDKRRREIATSLGLAALEIAAILEEAGCARMRQEFGKLRGQPKATRGQPQWEAPFERRGAAGDKLEKMERRGAAGYKLEKMVLGNDSSVARAQTDEIIRAEAQQDDGETEKPLSDEATKEARDDDETTLDERKRIYDIWQKTAKQRLKKTCSLSDMKGAATEIQFVVRNTSDLIRSMTFTAVDRTEKEEQRKQNSQPSRWRYERTVRPPGRIRGADVEALRVSKTPLKSYPQLDASESSSQVASPTRPPVSNVATIGLGGIETSTEPQSPSKRQIPTKRQAHRVARIGQNLIRAVRESRKRRDIDSDKTTDNDSGGGNNHAERPDLRGLDATRVGEDQTSSGDI